MADSEDNSRQRQEGSNDDKLKDQDTQADSTLALRNCVSAIFSSFTQFSAELNFGADAFKIHADPSKLQISSAPQPAELHSSIQQHISKLQTVSANLKQLMSNGSGVKSNAQAVTEESDAKSEVREISRCGTVPGEMWAKDLDKTMVHVDDNIVQIKAGKSEIDRRISAFIERKQAEINENNVREFCNVIDCNQVSRVVNTYGPQTRPGTGGEAGDKQRCPAKDCGNPAIEERLHNIEAHLRLSTGGPVPLSIYQRLKRLEDRILELEGLSPEYFQSTSFLHKRQKVPTPQPYTLMELDGKINALKATLLKKVNESLPMETDEFSL
ncbi:MAP3K12-binding inhibitory protein 1 isoform X2 [Amia ocellicauda]|uniref:MAP3K12-binding inhibitory protein 1 isoform X2 n=1 Tax=Amia ocellicauda TaxID=2972642 RepID=UPI0034642395